MEPLLSLYDYLGRPAGGDLGKRVNNFAMLRKEENASRNIETKNYKGKIQIYRKELLNEFFAQNPQDR